MNNIVDLEGRREGREFDQYLAQKRSLKNDLSNVIGKHLEQGCTPSMVIDELIDLAKSVRKYQPKAQ